MPRESIKPVDILRHELKALRFILDNFHSGKLDRNAIPPREDFQSEQGRTLYDSIVNAPSRAAAESAIAEFELDDVDIDSFLRLSGEHYYTYPALVRERASAIRTGKLDRKALPPREDFQSEQGRALYDSIVNAPSRAAAEGTIAELELDDVDIDSFLRLSGEHYYTYPALVRDRASAIRTGKLTVENT